MIRDTGASFPKLLWWTKNHYIDVTSSSSNFLGLDTFSVVANFWVENFKLNQTKDKK